MIDAALQPLLKRALAPLARHLVRTGISADQVTLAGFALGLCAVVVVALGAPLAALVLLAANRLADGLDGAVARLTRPTDRGAFLDISLDFAFYGLFPLGFALAAPGNALPAAVLIASFFATGSSFLAFAILAEKHGTRPPRLKNKGFYYLGGLTEGAETNAVFAAMCLWPAAFGPLAWLYAAACWVTAITRWHSGWTAFAPEHNDPA
jgi:phosphatidylglycerophosphate synthase